MEIKGKSMFGVVVIVSVVIVFIILYQNFFAPTEAPLENNLTATVSESVSISQNPPPSEFSQTPQEEKQPEAKPELPESFEGLSEELRFLEALDTSFDTPEPEESNPLN